MTLSGYVDRPDYIVGVRRKRNRITVTAGDDLVVADTNAALLVDEQDHGIVFYIPRADIRTQVLAPHDATSRCPFKGDAVYWRLADGGGPVAWEYPEPALEVALIKDHVAFYQDRVRLTVGAAEPTAAGR